MSRSQTKMVICLAAIRSRVEVETSRIIKKITQEKITQEKIYQETEYIKIPQNQYTDKTVDVTVEVQRQFHQMEMMQRKSRRRKPKSRLDLRYSERCRRFVQDT